MITDDVLERALGAAAEQYDVPPGAVERLRAQLATPPERQRSARRWRGRRPSRRQWLAAGAAASVAVVGAAFALGGAPSREPRPAPAAASPVHDVAGGSGGVAVAGGNAADAPKGAPMPAPTAPGAAAAGAAHLSSLAGGAAGSPQRATDSEKSVATLPALPDSARVVKTGQLALQVKRNQVGPTLSRLTLLAGTENGYVASSETDEGGGTPGGRVTMRVPVHAFEDTVATARGYGKVMSLQTSGEDVTAQYSDMQARIRALKATRETFLTLLSRATTIGDTLAVQQHVTDVQTQIDQLQGRLNVLANRSRLATLTVAVNQAAVPAPVRAVHHRSGLAKAVDTSVGRFVRGIEVIIGLIGPVLLAVLLLVLGWLGAKFGYRLLRRQLV